MKRKEILTKERFKQSNGFKPVFSYSYFLFKFMIKKKTTFVLPILSFILVLLVSLMPFIIYSTLSEGEKNGPLFSIVYAANTILIAASIISTLFSIMFMISKSINIFKDCESEGVELIVVSKPIERWQILLTKFSFVFILTVFISIVNLVAFIPGMLLTQSIYIQLNMNKDVSFILLSLFASSFIGCLVFSSIAILLSLSSSRKLSVSLSTSISYWTLAIGVACSNFVVPDPVLNLSNQKDKYFNYSSFYSTDKKLVYTLSTFNKLPDGELEKDINKANHNNDWFSALSWLNVGQFIYDINSKHFGGGTSNLYVSPFDDLSMTGNYSPTNIIKKTEVKFLKNTDLGNQNPQPDPFQTENYLVPVTIQNREVNIASNNAYDKNGAIRSSQTIFNISAKQQTTVEQEVQTYIPNNLESSDTNNAFNPRQTFSSYLIRITNNSKIASDILTFLNDANNKIKQNNNTSYSFNAELNKFIESYDLKAIVSDGLFLSLIEDNNSTKTVYYTNVRKLLMVVSVLNLLSSNGTSYLELSKAISTKDAISIDLEFYKKNSSTDKKIYTLTTQFNTQAKASNMVLPGETINSNYGVNSRSTSNYYFVEVVGNTSPVYGVTAFWLVIGITLFTVSVILYNRRDFK